MYSKYSKELLEEAVRHSESYAGVLRYLGLKQAGGTQSHIADRIKKYGIDTSHMTHQGHNKGRSTWNKKSKEEILILLPEGSLREKPNLLRRAMLEVGINQVCQCGLRSEWNGKPIQLEIDHINGNWLDNRIDNLRFLCPNCHSQELTNISWKNKAQ